MLFTQTKLYPWHCNQISKAYAKFVTLPLVLAAQMWVTFVDTTCQEK